MAIAQLTLPSFRCQTDPAISSSLRPPLKWAGGKRWQLPHIAEIWTAESHRRLVEPFCGGLAISLGLVPSSALLNDANPHVINFYRWLARGLQITFAMRNNEMAYYRCRDRFNELIARGNSETAEAAGLFYYLNRTGYNGLCRFNSSGFYNVPFGRYARIRYKQCFPEYKQRLSGWVFTMRSFEELSLLPGDFVYADPPYDVEFTQYSSNPFGWERQVRTAEWLATHKGPVVLSNQATKRIVRLYTSLGYSLRFLEGPRRINCTGDRTPAAEVLAIRNLGQ